MTGHPAVLGDFELRKEIGRGGMGTVYEAWQHSLQRTVALKLLGGHVSSTQSAVVRFQREAQAAAKLHHAHIVPIFGLGEEDGQYYYAMELIDGPGLNAVIARARAAREGDASHKQVAETVLLTRARRPVVGSGDSSGSASAPPAQSSPAAGSVGSSTPSSSDFTQRAYFIDVARHMATIADALDYAHREGVIHRDIKPHNLILGSNGKLMISDFGLARLAEQPGVTITGELIGSPLYMPPEQITGDSKNTDHRIDIYSLGATMYEWLTLTPPYPGETREQVISKILTSEALRPNMHNPAIPTDLETICLKAIERDPHRRYATAGALRDDLHRFLDNRPIKARRAGVPTRVAKFIRRHQLVSLATAAAMVAVVLGLALFSKEREVKTQTAAAELAKEDIEQLKKENRRLLEDFRRLIPVEIGAPLQLAEAALPLVQGLVGSGTDAATGGGAGKKGGADPAVAGTPAGIARRLAFDLHEHIALGDWTDSAPDATAALTGRLQEAVHAWDNQPELAAERIATYLDERPNHFEARQFHAALMGRLGRARELSEDAEVLMRLQPASPNAYAWRGLAHLLSGDAGRSLSVLGRRTEPNALAMWLLTLRGLALVADDRAIEAILSFDEALDIEPDLVVALLGRSFARATLGHVEGAITDLSRVLEQEPQNADVLALRGDRNAELANYDAAARDYDEAMNIAGRTPTILIRYLFARSQGSRTISGDSTPAGSQPVLESGASRSTHDSTKHSLDDRLLRPVPPLPQEKHAGAAPLSAASRLFYLVRAAGR